MKIIQQNGPVYTGASQAALGQHTDMYRHQMPPDTPIIIEDGAGWRWSICERMINGQVMLTLSRVDLVGGHPLDIWLKLECLNLTSRDSFGNVATVVNNHNGFTQMQDYSMNGKPRLIIAGCQPSVNA